MPARCAGDHDGFARRRDHVADRRTGSWVAAAEAVYTQTSAKTPMGSGIVAHADAASRDADPAAAGGQSIGPAEILRGLSAREGKAR
jgi:copper chaperone NosL